MLYFSEACSDHRHEVRVHWNRYVVCWPEKRIESSPTLTFKSYSNDGYFLVELQRTSNSSSFGFSIRGGREFSIPLFILKVAENGLADQDGQMQVIDLSNDLFPSVLRSSSPAIKSLKSTGTPPMAWCMEKRSHWFGLVACTFVYC